MGSLENKGSQRGGCRNAGPFWVPQRSFLSFCDFCEEYYNNLRNTFPLYRNFCAVEKFYGC